MNVNGEIMFDHCYCLYVTASKIKIVFAQFYGHHFYHLHKKAFINDLHH